MKRLLAILAAPLGYVYMRFCFSTSRYIVTDTAESVLRRTWDRNIPTVFACWHDEFLLSPLSLQCPRFPRPLFVSNDSFGGMFLQTICRLLRSPFLVIGLRESRAARLDALARGLAQHRRMTIAADYGRPWYRARASAQFIAERAGGRVVAMRLESQRKWLVRVGAGKAYLPVPFSAYAIWLGEPRAPSDVRLQEDLEELGRLSFFSHERIQGSAQPRSWRFFKTSGRART